MTAAAPAHLTVVHTEPANERICAIASGKGGVGKTWLGISLVQALAKQGRRALLFDGDLGLANVDIQLGLMPANDLQTVLAGKIALKDAVMTHDGGFDIIAGRSGSGGLASLPVERLDALGHRLQEVSRGYDHVLVDLGAGVETTVRRLAHAAGRTLVVTTGEPTSLTDAYAFIKLMLQDDPAAEIMIAVNMAASKKAGELTYQTLARACQSFLKAAPPLAGIVRRDDRVADAIRHQTPFLMRHPNTETAADVEALAERLAKGS